MLKLSGILLSLGLPVAANAQTTLPASDLRQVVEALQKAVKPSLYQKSAIPTSLAAPKQGRVVIYDRTDVYKTPLPLLIDNRRVSLDSLNRYTLNQVASINLNLDPQYTVSFGANGSWGVIDVKLKKKQLK